MEEEIIVSGNGVLEGEVRVSGAKNSALKLIAAAILGRGKTVLHNVPRISDIEIMSEVLAHLGADVERGADHSLSVDTSTVDKYEAPYKLVSKMRASISVLGPLIGRFGEARVAMPGGCQIGARKIDMHLVGLEALGVHFDNAHGVLHATTPNGLHGAHVMLEFPSVGATENTLMAAVVANGTTFIENAAREPEIVDLANMLSSMGAHIDGAGSSTIEVHGVSLDDLGPCEHTVVGDRIEAGTLLAAAGITDGELLLTDCPFEELDAVIAKMRQMGMEIEPTADGVLARRSCALRGVDVTTQPFPGFPTDMQAQIMSLMCLSEGSGVISETIFENRFMHVQELVRMGADIRLSGHTAIIRGVQRLAGAPVMASDLRASASLVLAGLAAKGTTTVQRIYHLDRGYEHIENKLNAVGARIRREAE